MVGARSGAMCRRAPTGWPQATCRVVWTVLASPYPDDTIDALVLDPPYMEGFFRTSTELAGTGTHSPFRARYSGGGTTPLGPKYHEAVLDLYRRAGTEAHRVLRRRGVFIVKCQDEVSANKQRLTHVELLNHYADSFYAKDFFVVVRA